MVYLCRQEGCDATFAYARGRCQHERKVHGGQLYVCDSCPCQFARHHELIHHQRQAHGQERYTCEECSKSFKEIRNYNVHMKRHQREHSCTHCGKVFYGSHTLKRHIERTHAQYGAGSADVPKRQRMNDIRDHYHLSTDSTTYSAKFQTTSTRHKILFRDIEVEGLPDILSLLHKVFDSVIVDITKNVAPNDRIQITIINPELDFPICFPITRMEDIDSDFILSEIERVLQSYQQFMLDETLEIHLTHIAIPGGSGRVKTIDLDKFLEKKKCIIRIRNNDNLCLARAIVTGQARVDGDSRWNSIRQGRTIQKELAIKLHTLAGIPLRACNLEDVKRFQLVLPDYQLNVVSKDHFNAILYSGPETDKRIYLYLHDQHYDLITSMPAFFNRNHWCTQCNKAYRDSESHRCIDVCGCCYTTHFEDDNAEWIECIACKRYFKGKLCFDNHKQQSPKGNSTCTKYYRCVDCGKTLKRKRKDHKCGEILCKVCDEYVLQDHKCYMKTVAEENANADGDLVSNPIESEDASYIFFDFETVQDNEVHTPNLCVSQKVCSKCINDEVDVCDDCGERQKVFYGPNTREEFCSWLFSDENKDVTCIAHNSKGFDSYFVLKYLHDNAILPKVIFNGAKIMSITVKRNNMRFIDSMNFIPLPLSQLPAAFGVEEEKGYFCHYFNSNANQHARLAHLPDKKYYNPDGMKPKEKVKFEQWYDLHKNEHFVLKDELIKYCVSDVNILRRCCLQFRQQFMSMSDIDPFQQCITIASACNLVFRAKFLKPQSIGLIPPHGYHPQQNQSIKAMQWLKYISATQNITIQHARNGKEFKVDKYPVDGYNTDTNTIYSFEGKYFHGCTHCYSKDTINTLNGKTMGELYDTTMEKRKYMESLGYNYVQMWECRWDSLVKEDEQIKQFVSKLDMQTSLNPRDAFKGGRTEGFQLFREVEPGEKIKYVDFTSLYPWVNKYSKYVTGHPKIITENIGDISAYEGLVKCKILPPRNLFLPVLPMKINDKLMFSLCCTCTEKKQSECNHTDEERAFIGTWVTDEIKKAVQKGYKILKIYEVWDFECVEQYNPDTKQGGLFSEYVNTFLKMKQEASGWPEWCKCESDRWKYIDDYMTNEGVQLNYNNIAKNPGLRSLAKLMLNSFWGKFGQRTNMTKTLYTTDPKEYFDMITSDQQTVQSARLVNSETAELQWCHADDFIEPCARVNVVVAAYTTAHARLKLYDLLDSLSDRILYADTDSVVYTVRDGQYDPPLGDYVGQLTNELESDSYISHFITAGPKNYAYQLSKPNKDGNRSCCKVRGITLNSKNSKLINFDAMSKMIRGVGPNKIVVVNERKICRDREETEIVNRREEKDYRVIFDKRVIVENYKTLPYGY